LAISRIGNPAPSLNLPKRMKNNIVITTPMFIERNVSYMTFGETILVVIIGSTNN